MEKALLDTDILLEIWRARNQTVARRKTAYLNRFGRYTISVVTVLEVVKGFHKVGAETDIQQFMSSLGNMEVLDLDSSSAEWTGRIIADLERIGLPIGYADSTIAAIALQHGLTLVTGNTSHYQRIQALGYNLHLDNWRV
jgi:tRNA(fMet)-specific endonuclease VapC